MEGVLTLLDVAKFSGSDQTIGLIEENLEYAPEFYTVPVVPRDETDYKYSVRTELPEPSFRNANAGTAVIKGEYVQRFVPMYFVDGQMEVDEMVAQKDRGNPLGSILATEANGVVKGAVLKMGRQFYYGTEADAQGFKGLREQLLEHVAILTAKGDTRNLNMSATGSGNATSSVYFIREGENHVNMPMGNGGIIQLPDDWRYQRITKSDNRVLNAWLNSMNFWIGLQSTSIYDIGRIKNLSTAAGKGMTDKLAEDLVAEFPIGHKPNRCFMNRRSARQLQDSRNALGQIQVTAAGQGALSPFPTHVAGIPITVTDSITNTETAV